MFNLSWCDSDGIHEVVVPEGRTIIRLYSLLVQKEWIGRITVIDGVTGIRLDPERGLRLWEEEK